MGAAVLAFQHAVSIRTQQSNDTGKYRHSFVYGARRARCRSQDPVPAPGNLAGKCRRIATGSPKAPTGSPKTHMSTRERTWVLVLAGGSTPRAAAPNGHDDGSDNGFGARLERRSLLKMALARARVLAPLERICVLVDRAQKAYLSDSLEGLPLGNVLVQPCHRGSAVEILLAYLTMLKRDPWARIVALPSHHYVHDEPALASTLLDVATPTAQTRNKVVLVGIAPDEPDPELAYIVPGRWFEDGTRSVHSVVNASDKAAASALVARGALWDSSIVAARAVVLLNVLRACMPDLVNQMEMSLAHSENPDVRADALAQLYARLPSVDFSRVVADGAEPECRVITSRRCGWFALGAPRRVAAVIRRMQLKATVASYGDPGRHRERGVTYNR
jgi:mannose-1-phosphate guanylyltransferase